MVQEIWDGPESTSGQRLWYGLEPGASFSGTAATTTSGDTTTGDPFAISVTWLATRVRKDPG